MAQEITVATFEKSARAFNKRGIMRSFNTMNDYPAEYYAKPQLGVTNKYVLEVTIDKEYAEDFQKFLKRRKIQVLGDVNYYHIGALVTDYEKNGKFYPHMAEQMEAIRKDYELMQQNAKPYKEVEDDDVKFFILPYNDKIETLCDFIERYKSAILEYANKDDITIIMNIVGYSNMIYGYFGFNFIDAESKNGEVIDYSSQITLTVDMKNKSSVCAAGILLSGIANNAEDIELMNCHIFANNLKYN